MRDGEIEREREREKRAIYLNGCQDEGFLCIVSSCLAVLLCANG